MFKFLAGRLIQMAILFVAFLSIVWLLLQAMPGDISDTLVGNPDIPLEARIAMKERLGLDQPLLQQYVCYISNFFRGELGVRFSRFPAEVSTILWQALPRTLVLFLTATLFAYWLGFKSGKLIAWNRGRRTEQGLITSGIFLQTVFYPWFVAGSLTWGMVADGFRPDRWDVIGALVCLVGVAVIMYAPRSA